MTLGYAATGAGLSPVPDASDAEVRSHVERRSDEEVASLLATLSAPAATSE